MPIIQSRLRRAWGSMRSSRSPSCSPTNIPGSKRLPACSAPACCSSSFPSSGSANTSSTRSRRISNWRSPPGSGSFSASSPSRKPRSSSPATLVTLGDLKQWPAILCLAGFIVIVALNYRNVVGATLIGILAVTLIGLPLGLAEFTGIVSAPPSLAPTFLQLDFSRVAELTFIIIVFSFLMVDVFDNAGTLIGVAHRAGLLDADGNLPRMKQALLADSFAAMFGALIGTSTTTSYIESAAGVSAGGRTGLTAVFVASFFLLALF